MKIEIASNARQDIKSIASRSERVAARIIATIQAMTDVENLNEVLVVNGSEQFVDEGVCVSILEWLTMQRRGADVWRLKYVQVDDRTLRKYRIIYAFYNAGEVCGERLIRVLAVVHRDELDDYNPDSLIARRIREDYESY